MSKIGRHVNAVDKERLEQIRKQPNLPNAEERYKMQQHAMFNASRSMFSSREEAPLFQSNSLANAYGAIETEEGLTIEQLGEVGAKLKAEQIEAQAEIYRNNPVELLSAAYNYNFEKEQEKTETIEMGNSQSQN